VLIRKGDLVRVNKWCSAGGLIGRVGIVKGFKSIGNADCARIYFDTGFTPLVRLNAVDVISSISEERKDGP
jgi:hypothetical protein